MHKKQGAATGYYGIEVFHELVNTFLVQQVAEGWKLVCSNYLDGENNVESFVREIKKFFSIRLPEVRIASYRFEETPGAVPVFLGDSRNEFLGFSPALISYGQSYYLVPQFRDLGKIFDALLYSHGFKSSQYHSFEFYHYVAQRAYGMLVNNRGS